MKEYKISDLSKLIEEFRVSRGWKKSDNPKDVSMGVSLEANELMAHFTWLDVDESWKISENQEVLDEIADVFIGIISMTNMLNIDIYSIVEKKKKSLNKKYPEIDMVNNKEDE